MSNFVPLTHCLKAVPSGLLPTALEVLNGGSRPSQDGLSWFSHNCQTPRIRVFFQRAATTLDLDGWTFAKFMPGVQAETEASRYFRQASSSAWSRILSIDDFCGPYLDDDLNTPYTWQNHTTGSAGSATYGEDSHLIYDQTTWSSGRLVWVGGSTTGQCEPADYAPATNPQDGLSMSAATTSETAGAATATASSRSCWMFNGDLRVYFDVSLSEEVTEADALAAYSPSWTPGQVDLGGVSLYLDGTFALNALSSSVYSLWEIRAGERDSFGYAQSTFTAAASGLIPGAQYRVTFLIASREAITSASEGTFRGDWSVHATPSYTFTAVSSTQTVIGSPYSLEPVQGYEIRLIWAGVERL